MLFNADIRQNFTKEKVNLEKQNYEKEILTKGLKIGDQSLR